MNSPDDDIDHFNIFKLAEEKCDQLLEIVLDNMEIYNFHIDSQDPNGNTLLHLITNNGNYNFARILINLGANVNITNNMNEIPLHIACLKGNFNIVKLLMENKSLANLMDRTGESPSFKAVRSGNLSIIEYLKTVDLDEVNHDQETLIHAAVSSGDRILVDHLIKNGTFDLNARSLDGSTPLHFALRLTNDSLQMLKALAQHGADLKVTDTKCRTLLHLAVEKKSLEVCKFLLDRGVGVNDRDWEGSTPLHYAVDLQLDNVTFLLVHSGADVNLADLDGYTPLHLAARKNADLVKFLMRNGALKGKTFNGDSPLHLAASSGNFPAAVVLLSGGIKGSNLNNDSYSPMQLAEMNGNERLLRLLEEHCGGQLSKIPRAVRRGRDTTSL